MRSLTNPLAWQILLAIARGRSLSAAADTAGMDTAGASRLIKSLETRLNLPLLNRSSRPVSLTPAAQDLLPLIADFVESGTALATAAEKAASSSSEKLIRLSVPTNFPRTSVVELTDEYRRMHPEVTFEILSWCEHKDVLEDRADIAVLAYRPKDEALLVLPLTRATTFLVATPAYLTSVAPIHAPEDLMRTRLILRSGPSYPKTEMLIGDKEIFDLVTGLRMPLPTNMAAAIEPADRQDFLELYVRQQRGRFLGKELLHDAFCGDAQSCLRATLESCGISADLSTRHIEKFLKSGELVTVLPRWHRPIWNTALILTKRKSRLPHLADFASWYAARERERTTESIERVFRSQGEDFAPILQKGF